MQIFDDIGFGGGNDTLDASGVSGNRKCRSRCQLVHFDQSNDLLAIVEPAGVTAPAQLVTAVVVGQVQNILGPVLNAVGPGDAEPFKPLGHTPLAPRT